MQGHININNSVLRPAGAPPAPVTPLLISVRSPEHHLEHRHQRRRPLAFGASQLRGEHPGICGILWPMFDYCIAECLHNHPIHNPLRFERSTNPQIHFPLGDVAATVLADLWLAANAAALHAAHLIKHNQVHIHQSPGDNGIRILPRLESTVHSPQVRSSPPA
ncbi:hypothetical protein ACLKA7_013204 [Drosophila subpalustris]